MRYFKMSYLKENKRQTKLRTDLLNFSVSKDETRLHLQAIWHDESMGALVSTNGHHATILRSRYSPVLFDRLIDPITYQIIERDPVRIKAVIPLKFKTILDFTIEKHHFQRATKTIKHPKTHFYSDGTLSVNELIESKELLFTVNSSFLKYLATGHTYTIGFNAELSPVGVSLTGDNFDGDIFIMMPLKI